MLLLKNDPIWTDLKSDVLIFDELLQDAHHKSVTGFIEFDFTDFHDIILLDKGEILQCVKIKKERMFPINESEILKDLKEIEAIVGFYKLKKEVLVMTYKMIHGKPIFENMSSKYVDIKQLLLTLEADTFTGIIVIQSNRGNCYIWMEKGYPLNCACNHKDEVKNSARCLENLLNTKNIEVSVYKEEKITDIIITLKEVARDILGEPVEKIEKMLEDSGTSEQELLKTVEEIEKVTYLFLDKKKANTLSEKLRKTIEEVIL
jgi:hypothetical protein